MIKVKDLVSLMRSRSRVWRPTELTVELNVGPLQLMKLITLARQQGYEIYHINDERSGNTSKFWIRG